MAISMLSEGCAEFFKNDIDGIMQMIHPITSNENPRIIYDVLTTYSLLCQEFYPDV
jgi:hypothetical protein